MKRLIKYYNQWLDYFTRNACSIYTLFMIIQIQWWIRVDNSFIVATAKKAEIDKVWRETWWAYFKKVYQWFSDNIYERTQVKIKVIAVDIRSDEFEEILNRWYAFWLWLKYAWRWYRKVRADWVITEEESDVDIKDFSLYGHNHTYFKWLLIDSLGSLSGSSIRMNLKALRKAVNAGIYYPTARTLVMEDKLLEKWLKKLQRWEKIVKVTLLPKEEFKAFERASKLRHFLK